MADAVQEALDGPRASSTSPSTSTRSTRRTHRATGTPEPGGLVAADLMRMVRKLAYEHNVVGMDIVEVAPAYDHADCTVNVANRLFMECLAGPRRQTTRCRRHRPRPPGTLMPQRPDLPSAG